MTTTTRSIPLSWSSFDTFKTCSLKWRLKYVDRVYLPQDERPFVVGSAVHDTMEAWAKAGWAEGYVRANIERVFRETIRERGVHLREGLWAKYWEQAVKTAMAAEAIYRRLQFPQHRAIVEFRADLEYEVSGVPLARLRGGWDVLDPVRGTIYDLKTGAADGQKGQLLTYGVIAAIEGIAADSAAFVYPLREGRRIDEFSLDIEAVRDHRQMMDAMVVAVHDDVVDWQPTEGAHCFRCPYYRTRHCGATFREGEELIR